MNTIFTAETQRTQKFNNENNLNFTQNQYIG